MNWRPESEIPPPVGTPADTRHCDLCHAPLDATHEGRLCTRCSEAYSAKARLVQAPENECGSIDVNRVGGAPTDRCPPPTPTEEPWHDEPTHPGPDPADPFSDPRFEAFFRRYEQCLDRRFESIVGWLRQELDELRSAARIQSREAEQQTALIRRWADDAAAVVTRVEQISERVDRREHYCATQHGNGASLPPEG
jgi:hypothetical protein